MQGFWAILPSFLAPESTSRVFSSTYCHLFFLFQQALLKSQFQCIAFLEGSYLPSLDHPRKGIFMLVNNSLILPAYLDKKASAQQENGVWKQGEINCFSCYLCSTLVSI
jgi:hypothetical protein